MSAASPLRPSQGALVVVLSTKGPAAGEAKSHGKRCGHCRFRRRKARQLRCDVNEGRLRKRRGRPRRDRGAAGERHRSGSETDHLPAKDQNQSHCRGHRICSCAESWEKNPDGSIRSQPLGNYCVVPIKANGEADITDLQKGYYDIDIKPAAIEYEVKGLGINLPEDLAQVDGAAVANVTTREEGKHIVNSVPYGRRQTGSLPNGWRLDRGMKARGEGLAFPRNERYLYFTGF